MKYILIACLLLGGCVCATKREFELHQRLTKSAGIMEGMRKSSDIYHCGRERAQDDCELEKCQQKSRFYEAAKKAAQRTDNKYIETLKKYGIGQKECKP